MASEKPQRLLLLELIDKIRVRSTTGLYEAHIDRDARIEMFIRYVRRLGNLLKTRKRTLTYLNASQELNKILTESKYDALWLCKELMGGETYAFCTNHFSRSRYIKSLITSYNAHSSDDKAGPLYARYMGIKDSKDTEAMRDTMLNDGQVKLIKKGLKRKYDDVKVEEKLGEIMAKQEEKMNHIKFLEKVKNIRMKELEFALKHDKQYQRWARMKSIWERLGFAKFHDEIFQSDVDTCLKIKSNGDAFEIGVINWIKGALITRLRGTDNSSDSLTEDDIDIVTNVEINIPKKYTGEIDIVAINKHTNKIIALIETKRNLHDIGFARDQLNKIVKVFHESPGKCYLRTKNTDWVASSSDSCFDRCFDKCDDSSEEIEHRAKRHKVSPKEIDEVKYEKQIEQTISSLPYGLTTSTELLIVTKTPTDEDNTGVSLPVIRVIADHISASPLLVNFIEAESLDSIILTEQDKNFLWTIMMDIVHSVPDFIGTENMIVSMANNLLVYDEHDSFI